MSPTKARYVNPLTDFGFKKIFGEEPNKDIPISFLNEILPARHKIQDSSYSKNEQLEKRKVDRKAIFDLYCTSTTGERFIVELQKAKQNYFKDRSIYYSSFPVQGQARQGGWGFRLDAVYTVGILDFIFDDHREEKELYHIVELKNQRNEVFYDKLKYIYIELPKFTKQEVDLKTDFDKWLYVFRHLADLDSRPTPLRDRIFERLFQVAEISNFTRDEQEDYENSLKYYRDIKNAVDTSREEGREEGVTEVARRVLEAGLDDSQIPNLTGLTARQLANLRD